MTKTNLKTFIESLKIFNMKFLTIAVYDLLAYAIIIPLSMIFFYWLNAQAQTLNIQGDLNSYLLSATQEQVKSVASNLQFFVVSLLAGGILLIAISLFAYAFSRNLIWNYLENKKFNRKTYLKSVLLFLIIFSAYFAILIVFNLISSLLMPISAYIPTILANILILLMLYFLFLAKYEYTKKEKIFASLGETLKKFKNKKTWIYYLYSFVVFLIFSLVISFTNRLASINSWLILISFALILIYLNWLRIYIFTVHNT